MRLNDGMDIIQYTIEPRRCGRFPAHTRPEWGQNLDSSELQQLQKHIREALNHLHDPGFLRKSPLAAAFSVSARFETPAALRGILVSAIEALQPQPEEPPGSRAWEVFQSLYYRYVEQFSQDDVANQMGISPRQLRRLQQSALEALTYHLSEQFHLQPGNALPGSPASAPPAAETAEADEELDWLKTSPPEETTDLSEVLPAAVALLRPLAGQHGVTIETTLEDGLPLTVAHPAAVRQALLNVLSVAVLSAAPAPQPPVRIAAHPAQDEVRITVLWSAANEPQRDLAEDRHKLQFAQRLVDLCAGGLQVMTEGQARRAVLSFSALAQRAVLAIDDNAQALQLLQRYAAGTRYRVVGAQDAAEALALTRTTAFQAIVVDVMMPRIDGWTVLAELRQNPLTAATPIIVCTVLPQRELALSLGATDFIQKPVSRQAFLQALDRQVASHPH